MLGWPWMRVVKKPRAKLARRPFVVVRRDERVCWGKEDAQWLRDVLENPRWRRLEKIVEDGIVNAVLPRDGRLQDPEFVAAMVAGQVATLEAIYGHAGRRRGGLPAEEHEAEQGMDGGWPIQMLDREER